MRSTEQRRGDTVARLEREPNIWLATASDQGVPHLIPLSLAWDGARILLATPSDSPTVRNAETGSVRLALDSADDVVLIDGDVDVVDFGAADQADIDRYVARVGWNPANETGNWSLLIVTPRVIRAWNGVAEITGRTIMRQGAWLG